MHSCLSVVYEVYSSVLKQSGFLLQFMHITWVLQLCNKRLTIVHQEDNAHQTFNEHQKNQCTSDHLSIQPMNIYVMIIKNYCNYNYNKHLINIDFLSSNSILHYILIINIIVIS